MPQNKLLATAAIDDNEAPLAGGASLSPVATVDLARRNKKDNREKILFAALEKFTAYGFLPVSMEDIASAAGVSRMTVYRHFSGKTAIAIELFERAGDRTMPVYLSIAHGHFTEFSAVRQWIVHLFATDRANRQLFRVFTQAADESAFSARAQNFIGDVIARLGQTIPAFAIDRENPSEHRRWLEAWLLMHELFDQSNLAAWDRAFATDPLMIDILASRFVDFVNSVRATAS